MTETKPANDASYRRESERIEALLGELAEVAGPLAFGRVEELLERMVRVYGAGLDRVLRHALDAGARAPELEVKLCGDELLSSLLLLHGLHPKSTAERVGEALASVRPYLGSHAGDVALVRVDDRSVAIRLIGTCQGCPSSRATLEGTIERAIFEAAPEIESVEVEGGPQPTPRELIPMGRGRSGKTRWRALEGRLPERPGERSALRVDGVAVMLFRLGEALLAYRDACGGCGMDLGAASLSGDTLECAACDLRFDIARAGQSASGPHLEPLPLLSDEGGARIGLTERTR
jgi:Fe-S cluster biogenesis protein NfuA